MFLHHASAHLEPLPPLSPALNLSCSTFIPHGIGSPGHALQDHL